jgi:glycosyltransferase involved in cell wall biosynthesis
MKIHVLPNPSVPVNGETSTDPFTIAAFKYIRELSPKYEIILYALPGSVANCQIVTINSNNITQFNTIASSEIGKRKQSGDIIACFYGTDNQSATTVHADCSVIEPSIGYRTSAIFAKYRVFTSYAQMHMFYGERGMLMNPSWLDAVIPNSFTVEDFEYSDKKDDYFLYFGRVRQEKGIDICIELTRKLNKKLVVAGPINEEEYSTFPSHVEYVGICDKHKRSKLMANAKCLLGPTLYIEPFGNMVIEANLCGTPVLTTDWGAFSDTVLHGKTGFRCRDLGEFTLAANMLDQLNPMDCREHGLTYSDEIIHKLHDKYLQKIIAYSI